MEVLILNRDSIANLLKIKEAAIANHYTLRETVEAFLKGKLEPKNEFFSTVIPRDFKVVLTVEEQKEPIGLCWHLSVSRPAPYHPSPEAVQGIIDALQLNVNLVDNLRIWFEEGVGAWDGTPTIAINILCKKEN